MCLCVTLGPCMHGSLQAKLHKVVITQLQQFQSFQSIEYTFILACYDVVLQIDWLLFGPLI